MIGKIQRVPLREVWKHEALDFTRWLEDNVDVLNDVIDITLSNAEREQSAGSFSVDLIAEDAAGNTVVIENQLEKSNHDHLGKLITYLTAFEAKAAVWIVAEPRPEHVNAISWLNESSSAAFYLLKVEAIRIDDSTAAPLLTLIVGPSEAGREAGKTKKKMAERFAVRHRFWHDLLERAKGKTKLHAGISPGEWSYIGTSAGTRGLGYNYSLKQHASTVELYIDRGKDSEADNKAIFDQLHENHEEIERIFGSGLEWERLESRRACRIAKRFGDGGYRDPEERWPTIQDTMIDAMIRLDQALRSHIKKLNIGT